MGLDTDEFKKLKDCNEAVRYERLENILARLKAEQNVDNIEGIFCRITSVLASISIPYSEDGDTLLDDAIYQKLCRYARLVFNCVRMLLESVTYDDIKTKLSEFKPCLRDVLKYISCFQTEINVWCDKETQVIANYTVKDALFLVNSSSVEDIISNEDFAIYSSLLRPVLPLLTRDSWKKSPLEASNFIYITLHSQVEVLSNNFDMILPFVLVLTDEYAMRYMKLGIRCLNHIMNMIPPSELRLLGRAEVIYDAVMKKLYTRESEVAEEVLPCLISCLQCLETEVQKKRGCRMPKHDECFGIVLNNFYLTSDHELKRIYSRFLPVFIDKIGIQIVGHMKALTPILDYGLESADRCIVADCLLAVSNLINVAWPRLSFHAEAILKSLVKALYNLNTNTWMIRTKDQKIQQLENVSSAVNTIAKMALISEDLVKETLQMLRKEKSLNLFSYAEEIEQMLIVEKEDFSLTLSNSQNKI